MSIDAIRTNYTYKNQFEALTYRQRPEKLPSSSEPKKEVKIVAGISALAGMGIALSHIIRKQGLPHGFKTLKKLPLSQWPIFKIAKKGIENQKLLNIEEKEILQLATGSVVGGLVGGAIIDRKNMKAKVREAMTQMVGNVLIPVAFVGGASRIYDKFSEQIKSAMPQFKSDKNIAKNINKFIKAVPAASITAVALTAGIITGSKITNLINEKCFNQKKHRDIKATDFAPHVDDLCLAVTLMGSKNSPLASTITRTVPLFLTVPGYQVGKAK